VKKFLPATASSAIFILREKALAFFFKNIQGTVNNNPLQFTGIGLRLKKTVNYELTAVNAYQVLSGNTNNQITNTIQITRTEILNFKTGRNQNDKQLQAMCE